MSSKSLLSARQWAKISALLPESRRDPALIEAVLFREHTGQSLSEVAELFGITRVRLHQWTHAIEADGSPARAMAALRLEVASRSVRSLSGNRPFYHRDPAMVAKISALRVGEFREALRASRR